MVKWFIYKPATKITNRDHDILSPIILIVTATMYIIALVNIIFVVVLVYVIGLEMDLAGPYELCLVKRVNKMGRD
jgi:hypothetical protein